MFIWLLWICSDIKGIVSVLNQIKEKAHKDGLKKNEETISRSELLGFVRFVAVFEVLCSLVSTSCDVK